MMQQLYVQETLDFAPYTQTQREADRALCRSYLKQWGQTSNRMQPAATSPTITLAQFQAAADRLALWADIQLPD